MGNRKGASNMLEKKCPVCGKNFIPAAMHAWKIAGYGKLVCSYSCMRKEEKDREVKRKQNAKARAEARKRAEAVKKAVKDGNTSSKEQSKQDDSVQGNER